MEIEVFRPKQYGDMARNYQLYADGKKIAVIKRGETKIVSIPDETESIQAKIDWCSSPDLSLSAMK